MVDTAQRLANLTPAQRQLLESRLKNQPQVSQPIAVVGMACRLPGANNLAAYWDLITSGRSAVREVPADRWDAEAFYDPDPDTPGKMPTKWGGFLDNVSDFDAMFFGISPREASRMDPQQRLLLEIAWEALENSNIAPDRMAGTATGVFVGIGGTDYSKIASQFPNYFELMDPHVGTGNALSISANRVSYILDLRGPSFAVDTACSSGTVGLHLAIQALRNNECDAALAGAVNLILSPEVSIAFSKARMLSPTGQCRPFDAEANGYVRGEGCAIVVLKRLTEAMRDGDNILAVIRGSAINQDGRTSGITAPNALSQQACIRAALASGNLTTDDVTYVEAHGTGTPLGDPIEFQSLAKLFATKSASSRPCYVTSVKANIGHTETVSGIAGLIKTVLMMQHRVIPAQAFLKELNPNIELKNTRLAIPREMIPWNPGGPLIAGVSSFGFGGTNSHIVLESADTAASTPPPAPTSEGTRGRVAPRPANLLCLSGKSDHAVSKLALDYAAALEKLTDEQLPDFCQSSTIGRSHFNRRAVALAHSRQELLHELQAVAAGTRSPLVKTGEVRIAKKPKVGFLFTGQGAQYAGMARSLYQQHPVFREQMDRCNEILLGEREHSLLSVIYPAGDDRGLLNETAYTQPALFAVEYALACLWRSWGVEPTAMLGHSVGEYVAACVAGVFSLEDGLRLIAKRAELMQRLPQNGSMAVIFARRDQVEEALRPYGNRVAVATANGPENNVISGERQLVEEVVAAFAKQGIGTQQLTVSHAFHSPLMDPILDEFEAFATTLTYDRPKIPIVSNRTGMLVGTADFHAAYWRDHLRNAVEFSLGMESMMQQELHALIEIGPTSSLLGMGKRCQPDWTGAWIASLRKGRDDWDTLLSSVAELYVLGWKIDWTAFERPWRAGHVTLPNYPFERARCWYDESGTNASVGGTRGPSLHPLLGARIVTAREGTLVESRFSADSPKYLHDHQVQGSVVVPAAGYVEQGLAMGQLVFGSGNHAVENLSIQQALFLPVEGHRVVQVTATPEMNGRTTFETLSVPGDTSDPHARWALHASGTARHCDSLGNAPPPTLDLRSFPQRIIKRQTREEFYQLVQSRGLAYGPMFQVLGGIERTDCDAVAKIELSDSVRRELGKYHLHPSLGDAMLQTIAGIVPLEADGDYTPYTYMPVGIRQVRIWRPFTETMSCYAIRTSATDTPSPEAVEGDIFLLDEHGEIAVEMRGVMVRRVGRPVGGATVEDPRDWLYRIEWHNGGPASTDTPLSLTGRYLVLADEQGFAAATIGRIREAGAECVVVRHGDAFQGDVASGFVVRPTEADDIRRVLEQAYDVDHPNCAGLIHCWSLDARNPTDASYDWTTAQHLTVGSALRWLQQTARYPFKQPPAIWLVTEDAQQVGVTQRTVQVAQSTTWGLGRVAALEHPELKCRLWDLDGTATVEDKATSLAWGLADRPAEDQIVVRGNERWTGRLVPAPDHLPGGVTVDGSQLPAEGPFRLRITDTGSFDGLQYEACRRTAPGAGQVEIEVAATGLNFSDILKAMGLYPGITDVVVPVGIECSGTVTAVGEGVDRFRVGDRVMGVAPYSFASHTVTADYALVHKPDNLDHQEASTVPVTFLTAYYGLIRLAQLQPGERVLIHAGAGGVGIAAIQIAQHLGAEVFATAGSDDKRNYLRSLGVKHVMNSRTLDFADEILALTNREGVDVVLNSLPGEAIAKSLSILRAYGRFLEIGKTDIYSNTMIGLSPFQDNLSYFAIDLDRMLRQRPAYVRDLFTEVMRFFADGHYRALPFTEFSADETVDAFRFMAQRKNIGKVVVSFQTERSHATAETPTPTIARRDGTYLITGGLGALGLQVARWLADHGAGHLALLARRAPSGESAAAIAELNARGVKTVAIQGDVMDRESLALALRQIPTDFAPLRGVYHAAGVLQDGVMYDMSLEQLEVPLGPKVRGTWNLHLATLDAPLEQFVAFSSIACLLGSPGQGNYAAANAFLDGFAAYRRSQGRPATSINWGPWADSGMAAEAGRDAQLASRGMSLLPSGKALEIMEGLLQGGQVQTAVMSVRWPDLFRAGSGSVPPLLRDIAEAVGGGDTGADNADDQRLRAEIARMSVADRKSRLDRYFAEQLGAIMGMDPNGIDVEQPLSTMGLDSLMAIELKNKIEKRLQIVMPMAVFMQEPSVGSLAKHVAETYGTNA